MKNKKYLNHSNLLLISPLYKLSSLHNKNEENTTETNSNTDQATQKNKNKFYSPHLKLKPLDLNLIKNNKNNNSFLKNKSLLNKILNFKSNKLPNIKPYFTSRNNNRDYFDHTKYIDYFKTDNNKDKKDNNNNEKYSFIFNTIYKNDNNKKNNIMKYYNKNVSSINLEKNINKIINKIDNKSITPLKKKSSLSPLHNLNYSLIKSNDITKVYYNFKNIINPENEMIEKEISNLKNSNLTTINKDDIYNNYDNNNKIKSKTIDTNRRGGYYKLNNTIDKLIGNKFKSNKKLVKKLEISKFKEKIFHKNNSNKIILKKLEEKKFYLNKNNKTMLITNNHHNQIKSIKNKNLFNKKESKILNKRENENINFSKLKSIIKKESKNLNKNQNKTIIYNLKTMKNTKINNINLNNSRENNLIPKLSNNRVKFEAKISKSLKNVTHFKPDNYIDFNRKKTKLISKSSFSSKKNIFEDDDGENLHEHESSFDSFHKYKNNKKTKKKNLYSKNFNSKKNHYLASNKSLNYIEIINLKKSEKNFLISLSPKNTLVQSLRKIQNDYFIKELKTKLKKYYKISYKETIPKINLTIEDCFKPPIKSDNNNLNILDEFYFLEKIETYKNFFECNKLFQNKVTIGESSFLTNKYLTINPQIIANFILPQIHQRSSISNIQISYSYNNLKDPNSINLRRGITRKVTKRITLKSNTSNIKILFNNNIFEKSILQDKNNLIFYEKIIYLDYSPINFDLDSIKRLKEMKNENEESIIFFSNNSSTEHIKNLTKFKTKATFKHKKTKKKINLELLKDIKLFNVNRNINNISLFNLYKEQFGNDSFLFDLLKEVEIYSNNLDNNKVNNSQIKNNFYMLLFYLFNYCINNNENILFVKIFNRYKDIFDINSKDKNNDNNTLLINATKVNSYKIVEFLLMKGSESNYRNRYGNTALHYAISYKYYKIVDLLKKYGAREDIENNFGQIPWECENGTCE